MLLMCKVGCTLLVAQLVEALRYKLEGRGFDSRWCHWNFSLTWSFRPHYDPGVDSASNRNEYQEYFLGVKGGRSVGLTTLPPSCADCLEMWESQPTGTLKACPGLYRNCFTFYCAKYGNVGEKTMRKKLNLNLNGLQTPTVPNVVVIRWAGTSFWYGKCGNDLRIRPSFYTLRMNNAQ